MSDPIPNIRNARASVLSLLLCGLTFVCIPLIIVTQAAILTPAPPPVERYVPQPDTYVFEELTPPPKPEITEDPELETPKTPPDLGTIEGIGLDGGFRISGDAIRFDFDLGEPEFYLPEDLPNPPEVRRAVRPIVPARSSGTVVAQFLVEANGTVSRVQIVHATSERLEAAVRVALMDWVFIPGSLADGTPVVTLVQQQFDFR